MVSASMAIQHTKWLEEMRRLEWRAPVASLNVLLTSTCWRNDHNGFSHQGPGLIDTMICDERRGRPGLPAARRELPALGRRPLPAQPRLRQPDRDRQAAAAAVPDLRGGRASTARAGASELGVGRATSEAEDPDIVLGCAGDIPTHGDRWPRPGCCATHVPELARPRRQRRRPDDALPAATSIRTASTAKPTSRASSGSRTDVVIAFHGYARALHQLLHGRPTRAASTSAASTSRARRRRRSTWSC